MRLNRSVLFALLLSGVGLALLLASYGTPASGQRRSRRIVDQQVNVLIDKLKIGPISAAEQRFLLERLMSLGRLEEAQILLESWQGERPLPLNQNLLLVELMRLNGDSLSADQELSRLLLLHPNNLQIMALQVLVQQDRGLGVKSLNRLKARFEAAKPGQRMELGLLLADLYRQSNAGKQAESLYRTLAAEAPVDERPVLALALIRVEQGRPEALRQLLAEAKRRRFGPGEEDPQIEALAASWSVAAAQIRVGLSESTPLGLP